VADKPNEQGATELAGGVHAEAVAQPAREPRGPPTRSLRRAPNWRRTPSAGEQGTQEATVAAGRRRRPAETMSAFVRVAEGRQLGMPLGPGHGRPPVPGAATAHVCGKAPIGPGPNALVFVWQIAARLASQ
jgi:hypothetical protein